MTESELALIILLGVFSGILLCYDLVKERH